MKETKTKSLRKVGLTVGVMALVMLLLLSSYQTAQLRVRVDQVEDQLGDPLVDMSSLFSKLSEDYAKLSGEYIVAINNLETAQQEVRRYTGNPFTTELWSGQLQSENITGMHWYTYTGGSLYNRTDLISSLILNTTTGYVDVLDYYRSGANYTNWIETLTALSLLQDGSEELTGDWDAGNYLISAQDINATSDFWRAGANYTAWIEDGYSSPSAYTYSIGWEGANIVARNSANVSVDSDTEIASVIQWCIDNYGDGLSIFVYNDGGSDYPATSQVTPQNDMVIVGEHMYGTTIKLGDSFDQALFLHAGSLDRFEIYNMRFDGNRANQGSESNIFDFYVTRKCVFDHLSTSDLYSDFIRLDGDIGNYGYHNRVTNCEQYGYTGGSFFWIRFNDENYVMFNTIAECGQGGSTDGAVYLRSGFNIILGNTFLKNRESAVEIYDEFGDIIIGNQFDQNYKACIYAHGDAKDFTVTNNDFSDTSYTSAGTYDIIRLEQGDGAQIINNQFRSPSTTADDIISMINSDNVTITGNNFAHGTWDNQVIRTAGTKVNLIVRDNQGFKTESWGVAELSNSDTVAHNLSGTPTFVSLIVMETDAPYAVGIESLDGTNIEIYLYDIAAAGAEVVDKTILFYAKYDP